MPSKRPPQTRVGHANGAEPVPGVVVAPGLELERGAPGRLGRLPTRCADGRLMASTIILYSAGSFLTPGRVPAGVHHLDLALHPGLALQRGQLVEGDGRTAGATRRGTGQDQPPHPVGVPYGELLGHHAAERDTHDEAAVPAARLQQVGGIVAVLGHGVGALGDAGLPQPALVIGQDLEVGGEGRIEDPRRVPQVTPGAGDEQEPLPRARLVRSRR